MMPEHSRRTFLATGGAAAAGVAAVAAAAPAQAAPGGRRADHTDGTDAVSTSSPLVVHVTDVQRGHLVVMHGDGEVAVTDPALARAIARAAKVVG